MKPNETPNVSTETFKSAVVIPASYAAYRDEVVASASKVTSVSFPNAAELDNANAANAELKAIIKAVEDVEEMGRRPLNARLKEMRRDRDAFLASTVVQHERLKALIDGFSRAKFLHDQSETRRLADEQRAAEAEKWKAAAEIKRQEEELARKKAELESAELSKKQRAEAEAKQKAAQAELLKAQLAAESANLSAQAVETKLSAPITSAKNLTVRVRWDFEIVDQKKCMAEMGGFIIWKPELESWRFDRAGFLASLNGATPSPFPPRDGETEAINSRVGIKVMIEVKGHTRR